MKPVKHGGDFFRDSNFKPVLFSASGARRHAKEMRKQLSLRHGYNYKLCGVKELDEYFVFTLS